MYRQNIKMKPNKVKKIFFLMSIIFICLLLTSSIMFTSLYMNNIEFKSVVDNYILTKEINIESLKTINIDDNDHIFLSNTNIGIIDRNGVTFYDSEGLKLSNVVIDVIDPQIEVNNNFIAINEKDGSKINVIVNQMLHHIIDVDGKIRKVKINNLGNIAIIVNDGIYKSILYYYDKDGNMVFKRYFQDDLIYDLTFSDNCDKLAILSLMNNGIDITSKISIINFDDFLLNIGNKDYKLDQIVLKNILASKINYIFDNSINIVSNNGIYNYSDNLNAIKELNNDNISIIDNLKDSILFLEEDCTSGNFNSKLNIYNNHSKKFKYQKVENEIKDIKVDNKIYAIDLGTEVLIYDNSFKFIKRIKTYDDISNIEINSKLICLTINNKLYFVNL